MSNLFQRLNNEAGKDNVDKQAAQKLFYLEHLVKQISESHYQSDFFFKGGFELASVWGWENRMTKDLDATLSSHSLDDATTRRIFNEIFSDSSDEVVFSVSEGSEQITPDNEYPGLRLTFGVKYKGATDNIQLDITTDDLILPAPRMMHHKSILRDGTGFDMWAYPLEQILADKEVSALQRSPVRFRAKDVFDVLNFSTFHAKDLDAEKAAVAFRETAKHKGLGSISAEEAKTRVEVLGDSPIVRQRWTSFQKSHLYAQGASLESVLVAVYATYETISKSPQKSLSEAINHAKIQQHPSRSRSRSREERER